MAAPPRASAFMRATSCTTRFSATPADRARSAFARQRDPVGQRQETEIDALVAVELAIERAKRRGVGIIALGIGDGAAPEHIVDYDEAALAEQREGALVIAVVIGLVGVDEGELEASRRALGKETLERLERWPKAQIDLAGDAGLRPIPLGDRRGL